MAQGSFVAYFRVSTAKQGRSGLGLEAQRASVMAYLNGGDWTLLGEFVEVESGKNNDRRELARAMDTCRLTGATLVIAKLDRLSRNAHFLIGLRDAGVKFVAVDMPQANNFTIGIMALVAEQEREATSKRTREALTAAKARGQRLGGYRGGPKVDGALGRAAKVIKANTFAKRVAPTLSDMRERGLSLNQMAAELTSKGILPPQRGLWTATSVRRVLARLWVAA